MTGSGGTGRKLGDAHSPPATHELQRRGRYAGQAMRKGSGGLAERRGAPLRPRGAVRAASPGLQPHRSSPLPAGSGVGKLLGAWLRVFISGAPFRGGSVASGPSTSRGATGVGEQGARGCAGVALPDGVRSHRVRASPYNPGLNLPRTSVAEFARSVRVAQVKPKVVSVTAPLSTLLSGRATVQ
jgi:hypothetical protein